MTQKFTAEEVRAVNPAQAQPLPCPFCGSKASRHKGEKEGSRWEYYCPNGHTSYLRMKEWNMRTAFADTLSKPADSGRVRDAYSLDLRHLIYLDTQFGWRGETDLRLLEMQALEARGWIAEAEENGEYAVTDEGGRVIEAALAAQGQGEAVAWRIDTDDDVERVAKIAGWDNRRYMTQADYAVWCERMREFVKLASTAPSDGGNEVKDSALLDWLEEQARNSQTGISFEYCKYTEDGYVIEKGYRFMRRHFLGERKPTLREAIVAAQQPTQPAEGE